MKLVKSILLSALIVGFGCFTGAGQLEAKELNAPFNLFVDMDFVNPDIINVFTWESEQDQKVDGFRMYIRTYDWETETASDWKLFRDEIAETTLGLGFGDLMNTLMSFRVTAYNADGESEPSNSVSVTRAGRVFGNVDYISVLVEEGPLGLVNEAPKQTPAGKAYSFDADALAEVLRSVVPQMPQVSYSLNQKPAGMLINSASGQIDWQSPVSGVHTVELLVLEAGSMNTKVYTWDIQVGGTTSVDDESEFSAVSSYPNPASDVVTLRFTTQEAQTVLRILTPNGVVVHSQTYPTVAGQNSISLSTQSLSAGAYFVQLVGANGSRELPLRIVR